MFKTIWLGAVVVLTSAFFGCGAEKRHDPPFQPTAKTLQLADIAKIGDDRNYPVASSTCNDWFPQGDGFVYILSEKGKFIGQVNFPFDKVSLGTAHIAGLGEIHSGQILYLIFTDGYKPVAKVVQIDPKKGGVELAIVGNIEGTC